MTQAGGNGEKTTGAAGRRVRVWDLPTRLFHWLLVLLVAVSFVTGEIGGAWMQYHVWSGCAIFGLLAFRIMWGFWGGRYARFSAFVRGPKAVLRYARAFWQKGSERHLGHNPLGGWSVLAMLAALLVQAATGLFSNDDIFTEGPLYPWVSKATSDWLTTIHRLNQEILLVLVAVHVAAVLFYLIFKRDNLIGPMFTGCIRWQEPAESSGNRLGLAALVAGISAALVYFLVR
ncbi:MAG: cytochrome b/b6 domain-containing protein [Desulfobacterales bacterium]|jgi:cytochrome b